MDTLRALAVQQWFDQSNEGVLAFDREGQILFLNAWLWTLLGLRTSPGTVEELVKQIETAMPEFGALVLEDTTSLRRVRWGSLRLQKYHPQYMTWQRIPLIEGDENVGTLLILRDASTQGHTELSKQSFLSMISHDIRTPLSTILGYAELMHNNHDAISGDDQLDFLEHIIKNANQLNHYAQIALDVMYLEADVKSLETETVLLTHFVEKWLTDASHRLAMERIILSNRNGRTGDLFADVSPPAMHRILNIVVEFALEESPPDEPINIHLNVDDTLAHVVIEHKAPTLQHEHIPNLFRLMHPRDLSEESRPQLHRMQLYVANVLATRQHGFLTIAKQNGCDDTYVDLAMPLLVSVPET